MLVPFRKGHGGAYGLCQISVRIETTREETCHSTGKVAVVTGGSRGLGRGIALELGKRGAKVVVNYNTNVDAANEVVQLIKDAGSDALAVQSDVSQYDAAQSLIKAAHRIRRTTGYPGQQCRHHARYAAGDDVGKRLGCGHRHEFEERV